MKRTRVSVDLAERTWHGLECGHESPSNDETRNIVDCQQCDRREIPPTTRPGRQTPIFDNTTVPSALLGAHQTNAWAELVVLEGQVEFFEEGSDWAATAAAGRRVVIVPNRPHRIEPNAEARFYVQFHDLPKATKTG